MAMPMPPQAGGPQGEGSKPSEEEVVQMLEQILQRALQLAEQFGIDLVAMVQDMSSGGGAGAPPPPPSM